MKKSVHEQALHASHFNYVQWRKIKTTENCMQNQLCVTTMQNIDIHKRIVMTSKKRIWRRHIANYLEWNRDYNTKLVKRNDFDMENSKDEIGQGEETELDREKFMKALIRNAIQSSIVQCANWILPRFLSPSDQWL